MTWAEFWTGAPRYPLARRVIVHTKTEKSFRGVLWQRRGDYLVLRNAELLSRRAAESPREIPVDGELVIPAANVEYLQVFGEATV